MTEMLPQLRFPPIFVLAFVLACAGCDSARTPGSKGGPLEGTKVGQERNDNGLQMTILWITTGTFVMGSPKEEEERSLEKEDQVNVTLTKGFWLGKYEVTQAEWYALMRSQPWKGALFAAEIKEGDDIPVVNVDWHMAREFCSKLTERERNAGRLPDAWEYTLPTEAQWEYACRAGTTTRYSFGDEVPKLPEYAWFEDNANDVGETYAHRVGQKKPNPWGLFDMHGNVFELCRDEFSKTLPGGIDPIYRSENPHSDVGIVFRGGSWYSFEFKCRSAARTNNGALRLSSYLGFRVALVPIAK